MRTLINDAVRRRVRIKGVGRLLVMFLIDIFKYCPNNDRETLSQYSQNKSMFTLLRLSLRAFYSETPSMRRRAFISVMKSS